MELQTWNPITTRFDAKNHPVNFQMNRLEQKFQEFISLNSTNLSQFDATYVKNHILGINLVQHKTVLIYIDDYFENAVLNNVDRMPGTIKMYRRANNHMKQFLKHRKQESLLMTQLNFEIAQDFKDYLVTSNKDQGTNRND